MLNDVLEVEEPVMQVIKWGLSVVKEGGQTCTPQVQLKAVEIIGKIVSLLRIEPKVVQIMPGLSSVSTKVLGGEVKVGIRVMVEVVKLWLGDVLPRYLFWVSTQIKEKSKPMSSLISSLLIK